MTTDLLSLDPGNETGVDGAWIATFTGERIEPLDPDPFRIHPEDIAHSLATQCRFTGHVREFYSVAQHSVLVSTVVPEELRLPALLHDAAEVYLSDIASPIKREWERLYGFTFYEEAEDRLTRAVCERFGLDYPLAKEIKIADKMLLRAEQRDLMPNDPTPGPVYGPKIIPWSWQDAERIWIGKYNQYTGESVPVPGKSRGNLWWLKRNQRRKD